MDRQAAVEHEPRVSQAGVLAHRSQSSIRTSAARSTGAQEEIIDLALSTGKRAGEPSGALSGIQN